MSNATRSFPPGASARGAARAAAVHRGSADEAYRGLYAVAVALRSEGLSLARVAARLNEMGLRTRRGRPWNAVQVRRVLLRAGRGMTEPAAAGPETPQGAQVSDKKKEPGADPPVTEPAGERTQGELPIRTEPDDGGPTASGEGRAPDVPPRGNSA